MPLSTDNAYNIRSENADISIFYNFVSSVSYFKRGSKLVKIFKYKYTLSTEVIK